ncbi:MAG: hypothetical protein IPK93_02650 [Solirubrobacterales bacterium]|nr:hypothetical protein [Solirubrobacterales bacterium]
MTKEGTPVVAGHVYGLRLWSLSTGDGDFRLSSANARHEWRSNETRAKCGKDSHAAPAKHCSCGYYCFHANRETMLKVLMTTRRQVPGVFIAGVVKTWGRTEVHADGIRSEFASPDVLFLPGGATAAYKATLRELADKYGAEIWTGSGPQLLQRMEQDKPGLSSSLVQAGRRGRRRSRGTT